MSAALFGGDSGAKPPGRVRQAARKLLGRRRRFFPLPLRLRVALFLAGWTMVLVGVVGLILPGIQGVVTILAGAALLSLGSEYVYRKLHGVFERWPKIWHRLEGIRFRLLRRLRRGRRG